MDKLKGKFEGWTIDEEKGIIFDDGNNKYTINDVRATFYERQLHALIIGNKFNIYSLKNKLEKKLKNTPCPTITIDWGDGTNQIIKHPKYG